ncbi:MAG: (2Fe-2S)-binding protein [Rhodospirillaceae bacterium]|jgi:aerobic carbon-monoxide dehydrogenase small subunit|nr:(2Fe-2S)-binding protein [Rhodospirillaceae bacterium]MBT5194613.1 (2Fe-2S)-binding protein [Rhodospirillaceae bacterium]MBT5896561.1 (2Fe-2S)-binding protein [Rhodospirillaceae bacterium]MBT6429182.1 (2Fe-2S)-binding protein [Rhodospirillaceae bacterium]MBT7759365.1 (2Fe-2S)-binding protein [Rhodospirillaceae bacterium]
MKTLRISLTVNGEVVEREVPARLNLVDFLRHDLGFTGSHVGCEQGACGACTVLVDGETVRGCLLLAVQADGCKVETIEIMEFEDLRAAFHRLNALQCGFCTPGMLLSAQELLQAKPKPSRAEIREYLSGNFCRCTGYQAIVDAVEAVARARGG